MSESKTPAKTPAKKKPALKPQPPVETYKGRVRKELAELNLRRESLTSFLSRSVFFGLEKRDQELLREQAVAMKRYSQALQERVNRFGVKGV